MKGADGLGANRETRRSKNETASGANPRRSLRQSEATVSETAPAHQRQTKVSHLPDSESPDRSTATSADAICPPSPNVTIHYEKSEEAEQSPGIPQPENALDEYRERGRCQSCGGSAFLPASFGPPLLCWTCLTIAQTRAIAFVERSGSSESSTRTARRCTANNSGTGASLPSPSKSGSSDSASLSGSPDDPNRGASNSLSSTPSSGGNSSASSLPGVVRIELPYAELIAELLLWLDLSRRTIEPLGVVPFTTADERIAIEMLNRRIDEARARAEVPS